MKVQEGLKRVKIIREIFKMEGIKMEDDEFENEEDEEDEDSDEGEEE